MTGEQALSWAKATAVTVGIVLGAYGSFRGEPGAELAYKELAKNFNELRTEFEKQRSYNEGFLAGFKAPPAPPAQPAKPVEHQTCEKPDPPHPLAPHPVTPAPTPKPTPEPSVEQPAEPAAPAPPRKTTALPKPMPPLLQQLKMRED